MLADMLEGRDKISNELQQIIDARTEPWGIKVISVEVRERTRSPFGFLTGIPFSLIELARNFAGFGDEHSRLISADFTPDTLPAFTR